MISTISSPVRQKRALRQPHCLLQFRKTNTDWMSLRYNKVRSHSWWLYSSFKLASANGWGSLTAGAPGLGKLINKDGRKIEPVLGLVSVDRSCQLCSISHPWLRCCLATDNASGEALISIMKNWHSLWSDIWYIKMYIEIHGPFLAFHGASLRKIKRVFVNDNPCINDQCYCFIKLSF